MNNIQCEPQDVSEMVREFITREDCPENFIVSLDFMFDTWLTHERTTGLDAETRADVLTHYRRLQQLLKCLENNQ